MAVLWRKVRLRQVFLPAGAMFFGGSFLYKAYGSIRATSDFSAFWSAGRALNVGIDPYKAHDLLHGPSIPYLFPFVSPVFMAEFMQPLGALPFHVAKGVWLAISVGLGALSLATLLRFSHIPWSLKTFFLGGCMMLAFNPADFSLVNGQTDWLVLLAMTFSWFFLRRDQRFFAGLVLCVGAVNPNLIIGFVAYFIVRAVLYQEYDLLAGLAIGGIVLLIITLPYWSYDLEWVRSVLPAAQLTAVHNPGQISVLRVFSTVFPAQALWPVALMDILILSFAVAAWMRLGRTPSPLAMALAVTTTLLVTSYAFNQDYLVMVLLLPTAIHCWRERVSASEMGLLTVGAATMFSGIAGFVIPPRHLVFEIAAPLVLLLMLLSQSESISVSTLTKPLVAWSATTLGGFFITDVWLHSGTLEAVLVLVGVLVTHVAMTRKAMAIPDSSSMVSITDIGHAAP